tara:strand:- start:186 stop:467 length:282 start_codon:yes stop_codon:yes gene_type:complete
MFKKIKNPFMKEKIQHLIKFLLRAQKDDLLMEKLNKNIVFINLLKELNLEFCFSKNYINSCEDLLSADELTSEMKSLEIRAALFEKLSKNVGY